MDEGGGVVHAAKRSGSTRPSRRLRFSRAWARSVTSRRWRASRLQSSDLLRLGASRRDLHRRLRRRETPGASPIAQRGRVAAGGGEAARRGVASGAGLGQGYSRVLKGRIYPDGRVALYKPAEILANVKKPRTVWHQGERVDLGRVERARCPLPQSAGARALKDLQQGGCRSGRSPP
jgi:hypothetical protein